MKSYKEFYDYLSTGTPETTFAHFINHEFKHPDAARAFRDYLQDNYQLAHTVRQKTFSTNHVYYHLLHNSQNSDVLIQKEQSGCFHSRASFMTIEDVVTARVAVQHKMAQPTDDSQAHETKILNQFQEQELVALQAVEKIFADLKAGLKPANNSAPKL